MAIKIFIDQGHNPENPNAGAEANGLREQDITYDVGMLSLIHIYQHWHGYDPKVIKHFVTSFLIGLS